MEGSIEHISPRWEALNIKDINAHLLNAIFRLCHLRTFILVQKPSTVDPNNLYIICLLFRLPLSLS